MLKYIWIILLSIVLPFCSGIHPYTAFVLLALLFLNIIYICISIVVTQISEIVSLRKNVKIAVRLTVLTVYAIITYIIFDDMSWMAASVIFPELLMSQHNKGGQ